MHVIVINDAGLQLAGQDGILFESPGYAVLEHDRLVLGADALREARLNPRHTNHHFWARLSTDALALPAPRARTQADLAYAHLCHLWELGAPQDDEVIFAVPATLRRDQLSLLLGIARQCPFRPVGLVDLAVAALAADGTAPGKVLHVDGELHRSSMTALRVGEAIERTQHDESNATALAALRDAWVGLIAERFIRETRLDPFHDAATEQQMHDRLDEWLATLTSQGEGTLEMSYAGNSFRVTLELEELIERVRPRYRRLAERLHALADGARDARLVISHRLAALPGLAGLLESELGMACQALSADAPARGALAHAQAIRSEAEALAFVTRLPNPAAAEADMAQASSREDETPAGATRPAPPGAAADAPQPTHLLLGERAWPLDGRALVVGGSHDASIAHPALPEAVCRLRSEGGAWRLEPLPGASVTIDGRRLESETPIATGEEVMLAGAVRMALIIVCER